MRVIGLVVILAGLLLVGYGAVVWDGRMVIAGGVGLFVGSWVHGKGRDVASVVVIVCCGAGVDAGPPLTDSGAGLPMPGRQGPRFFVESPVSPEAGAEAARVFLETLSESDRPYIFFQWWGAVPEEYRRFLTLYRVYLQTINSQSPLVHSLPVPGTDNAVWFYDLRLAGQTTTARAAVARRDNVFREPFISNRTAEGLRRLAGLRQDVRTFHCEVIVPGPWFLRQIMQPEGQSPAYYDLLYAVERFGPETFPTHAAGKTTGIGIGSAATAPGRAAGLPPEPVKPVARPWPGGVWTLETGDGIDSPEGRPFLGREFAPGAFSYVPRADREKHEADLAARKKLQTGLAADPGKVPLPPGQTFLEGKLLKDFPATLAEFEERWGDKAIDDYLKRQNLRVDNGEVVAGILDDPRRGSIVSYRNRLIKFSANPFNNGGTNASTKDFFKSSGKNNLANFPKEAAFGQIDEDASEHLYTLPNGMQAAFLAGAAKDGRKRVDFGDGRLVRSSLDPHHGIVFTQYSCVICHGPNDGIMAPTNRKLGGAIDAGRGPLIKDDPLTASVISQFATDWDWKMEGWRRPYSRAVQRMTATRADPKGWDGSRFARETVEFVGWYDYPVSLPQAAAELGIPQLGVMIACLVEGSYDAQELFMGEGVPRATWDEDLFPRLALIYAGMRETDPLSPEGLVYRTFLPELVKQAGEKVQKASPQRSKP